MWAASCSIEILACRNIYSLWNCELLLLINHFRVYTDGPWSNIRGTLEIIYCLFLNGYLFRDSVRLKINIIPGSLSWSLTTHSCKTRFLKLPMLWSPLQKIDQTFPVQKTSNTMLEKNIFFFVRLSLKKFSFDCVQFFWRNSCNS